MEYDLETLTDWLEQFNESTATREERFNKMQELCALFGHPEKSIPCFHVIGSKGKGTITCSIAQILKNQGYSVGVYTSPHVTYFTERIRSADGPFPKEVYDQAEQEIKRIISGVNPDDAITWKVLVNIFAMLCFKIAKVDFAVYEAGIGGRFDSTNVVLPKAVAVGPIELEHTKTLGDTLTKIAEEKSGAFKEGVPVISAIQDKSVKEVFEKESSEKHTRVEYVSGKDYLETDIKIATECVKKVFPDCVVDIESIEKAIHLPGRYEIVKKLLDYPNIPFILLDVAHTSTSTRAVLDRMIRENIKGNLIFGCAKDKNSGKIAELIKEAGIFKKYYLTRPGDYKKSNLAQIIDSFEKAKIFSYVADEEYKRIIRQALQEANASRTPLIVLGSFYMVGEVKKVISSNS